MFTVIALTVALIIVVPILSFLSTTHLTTIKTLERWESYLAREAGVEYSIARLKNDRSLLTSLSSVPLTPVALPLPPAQTNGQAATSLTATLITPSQWDLVELPPGIRDSYVGLLPPELPIPVAPPPPVPLPPLGSHASPESAPV
ncbi:MAG: hypothetical protein Q7R34_13990, partial [Dehalococcoidia bacterium]|nr:hypothetical protein [Dehalococcoidia bacterium]